MNAKHTPGPWRIWTDTNGRLRVGPSSNYYVAEMFQTPLEGQEANARLIAVVPELLKVAELVLSATQNRSDRDYQLMHIDLSEAAEIARAATAKATGEPQ